MKQKVKTLSSVLLALTLAASLTVPSFAANDGPRLIIHGKHGEESSVQWVGTYEGYTETDLFLSGFKNVMPGDTVEQTVWIENDWRGKDYVELYMTARLHDTEENQMHDSVRREQTGESEAEKLAYMHDFLHQLTLSVENDGEVIYQGHPDELLEGFEDGEKYSFGDIYYGESVELNVTLSVPIEMGNEYADRAGEVDWVFTWSGRSEPDDPDPTPDPDPAPDPDPNPEPAPDLDLDPDPTPDSPMDPDRPVEPERPADPNSPKTGDDTAILPFAVLFAIGLMGMIATTIGKRKKHQD